MELLIREIVARNLYRDVNDAVQKAFTVLIRGNILRKTEYSINPQMNSNDQDWVSSSLQDKVDYKWHAP